MLETETNKWPLTFLTYYKGLQYKKDNGDRQHLTQDREQRQTKQKQTLKSMNMNNTDPTRKRGWTKKLSKRKPFPFLISQRLIAIWEMDIWNHQPDREDDVYIKQLQVHKASDKELSALLND